MNILHVSPTFYPAIKWGGPIFSTKAICDGLAKLPGMSISVLTTDAAGPNLHDRLECGREVQFIAEKYMVTYTRRIAGHSVSIELLRLLPSAIKKADVVHLTGTYNFPTLFTLFIARLTNTPVVWSPRGALQATAAWRDAPKVKIKHMFERVAQWLRPRSTVLLVTSLEEGYDSINRLPGIRVQLLPNSVAIPSETKTYKNRAEDASTSLIFLSRIHPKKGIELLLSAMHDLPSSFTLDIFGDGDPAYITSLKDTAAPFGDRVQFRGIVYGAEKTAAYQNADIFVLPSYSENFGIVVAEALAAGTPAITTTNTPWVEINRINCGRCIALDQDDLAKTIQDVANADLAELGAAGRSWMQRSFSNDLLTAKLAALYESII